MVAAPMPGQPKICSTIADVAIKVATTEVATPISGNADCGSTIRVMTARSGVPRPRAACAESETIDGPIARCRCATRVGSRLNVNAVSGMIACRATSPASSPSARAPGE